MQATLDAVSKLIDDFLAYVRVRWCRACQCVSRRHCVDVTHVCCRSRRLLLTAQVNCGAKISLNVYEDTLWLRQRFAAVTANNFEAHGVLNQLVHLIVRDPHLRFVQPGETAVPVGQLKPLLDVRGGYVTVVRRAVQARLAQWAVSVSLVPVPTRGCACDC
jgi:hypothetical protein